MDTMEIDRPTTAVAVRSEPSVPAPNGGLLAMLDRIMSDPTVSIDRVNAAFDFYQRARDDQAKRDFMSAFSACQAEMGAVSRDAVNPQTKSKYVTFAALDGALRPIYTRHGFGLSFDTTDSPKPEHIRVVCTLFHSGGHERRYTFDAACDGRGPKGAAMQTVIHAEASGLSYGRRYLEGAIFNIASEDDDGNAASRRPTDRVPDAPVDHDDVRISSERVDELTGLIASTNSNMDRFLKWAKVKALAEIHASDFSRVKAMLLRKAAQKKDAAE